MTSEAPKVEVCKLNVYNTTTFVNSIQDASTNNEDHTVTLTNSNTDNIATKQIAALNHIVENNTEITLSCDQLTTNAVTRSWSDLHIPTWFALLSANITLRTLIFHPLQMSIQRKRVTRESNPPSVRSLIAMAYRGGTCHVGSYESGKGTASSSSSSSTTAATPRYDLGKGGVRGLYRGCGAALTANLIGEISFLFALELVKEKVDHMFCEEKNSICGKKLMSSSEHSPMELTSSLSSSSSSSPSENEFCVHGHSTAVGAISADFASLFLDTPIIIIANRQITAQYGMALKNKYRNMRDTFREVWNTYQTPQSSYLKKNIYNNSGSSNGKFNNGKHLPMTRSWLAQVRYRTHWFCNGLRGIYMGTSAGLLRIPSSGCWWTIYVKSKSGLYYVASPFLQSLERKRLQEEEARQLIEKEYIGISNGSGDSNDIGKGHKIYNRWKQKKPFWRQNWFLSSTDNPLLNATAAAFASVATTILFNPLAVIQTRQQTLGPALEQMTSSSYRARARDKSWSLRKLNPFRKVFVVASDLMKKEGPRGFFKGATANVSVAVMDGVIFSLLFELTKLGSDVEFLERLKEDNTLSTSSTSSMRVV